MSSHRVDVPDLSGKRSSVRIRRKPVRKSQVETWTVRPSIETPDQEEKIPREEEKTIECQSKENHPQVDRRRGSDGGGGCVVPDDHTADLHRDRGGGADTGGERREQLLCKVRGEHFRL